MQAVHELQLASAHGVGRVPRAVRMRCLVGAHPPRDICTPARVATARPGLKDMEAGGCAHSAWLVPCTTAVLRCIAANAKRELLACWHGACPVCCYELLSTLIYGSSCHAMLPHPHMHHRPAGPAVPLHCNHQSTSTSAWSVVAVPFTDSCCSLPTPNAASSIGVSCSNPGSVACIFHVCCLARRRVHALHGIYMHVRVSEHSRMSAESDRCMDSFVRCRRRLRSRCSSTVMACGTAAVSQRRLLAELEGIIQQGCGSKHFSRKIA